MIYNQLKNSEIKAYERCVDFRMDSVVNVKDYKQEFIKFMVRSGVLTFGDFVTKSGRNTPYFINTGNYKTGAQAAVLGKYYAMSIVDNFGEDFDVLFGPAYKGIPLSVAAAIALFEEHKRDVNYCFNRKEAKDHGEGGVLIGHKLSDGDRVIITEDVITAGTAVRETLPVLKNAADVKIVGLIVSVDRMERGKGELSAIQEVYRDFGIVTRPIVTVREIISALHNVSVDGKIVLDDYIKDKMEEYLLTYGIKEN